MPEKIERRIVTFASSPIKLEKRAGAGGKEITVCSGYAATFFDESDRGTTYELYPGLSERIMPGCFDRCISERQDVRGLFNHDANHLLGRMSAGTMRLSIDRKGLRYEIDLPDTQSGRDVATSIERGDIPGSSFSFRVIRQAFHYNEDPNASDPEDDIRELLDVDVIDVGPVSFPAYASTTTGVRAEGDFAEVRSACDAQGEQRGVIRFQQHPLIDSDEWDADAAMQRVKAWASEGDRMSMRKFGRAFGWHDGSSTEAGHRLLHHDVRDGKLHTHRGAITRCLRMMDEDDACGVPEDDRASVRSHLERHRSWDDDEDEENDDEEEYERKRRAASDRMRLQLAEAESA